MTSCNLKPSRPTSHLVKLSLPDIPCSSEIWTFIAAFLIENDDENTTFKHQSSTSQNNIQFRIFISFIS